MTNRLAELDRTHKTIRKQKRQKKQSESLQPALTRTKKQPLKQKAGGLKAKKVKPARTKPSIAKAMTAVNYQVPGLVPVISQPKSMACWATVVTMLMSWRDNQSRTIEDTMRLVGSRWLQVYQSNTGLFPNQEQALFRDVGLSAEDPQSLSVSGWQQLLQTYGPLWVTTDERPGQPGGFHARVITAIRGDGSANGTRFSIVDPAGGRSYTETIADFLPKYEAEIIETGRTRFQVIHWAQATTPARSRSQGLSRRNVSKSPMSLSAKVQASAPRIVSKPTQRLRQAIALTVPVNYQIPGTIPVLAQPTSRSCWATVFTMLLSWKRAQSLSIQDALATVGQRWVNMYDANTGILSADKSDFISESGLVAEPFQNPTIEGWEQLLRNYGPLWVTTDEAPSQPWGIHARIIVGIQGDGTANGTRFTIIDPSGGRQYQERFDQFLPKYEAEIRQRGEAFNRVQIIHWHRDARGGLTRGKSLSQSLAAMPGQAPVQRGAATPDLNSVITTLKGQGISEDEILQFLKQINVAHPAQAKSYHFVKPLGNDRLEVHLPKGQVLDEWKAELLLAAIAAAAPGPVGLLLPAIRHLANRANVTVGVGPALTAGFAAGVGGGVGLLFAPGNKIGFYGTLSGVVGAIVSISATMQITIIHGGPSVFGGPAIAVGLTVGADAPVGPTGGAFALLSTSSKFIGVTFEAGVSAGLSPLEAYAQYQYTATTMALALEVEEIPLTPANGGQSVDTTALSIGDIILSTGKGLVSSAIRSATDSDVSHAALYVGNGNIVEAAADGVELRTVEQALSDDTVAVAFHFPGLTEEQGLKIRDFAGQQLGKKYNYWGIVKHARFKPAKEICLRLENETLQQRCISGAQQVFIGTPDNETYFCSQLVVAAYKHAGVPLTNAEPNWVTPNDLAEKSLDSLPDMQISDTLQYVGHLKA